MIFSKKSWHYRIIKYSSPNYNFDRVNLRYYFWSVIVGIYFALPELAYRISMKYQNPAARIHAQIAFAIFFLWPFLVFLLFIIPREAVLLILGGFYIIALTVLSLPVLYEKIFGVRVFDKKKPNLLLEYLKARKNKVCPILQWKD